MDFKIRKARKEDAASIANVHVLGWQQSYKEVIDKNYLDKLANKDNMQKRNEAWKNSLSTKHQCYVVIADNSIVGFSSFGQIRADNCSPDDSKESYVKPNIKALGEVYAIYILDKYKQQGIGTSLWKIAMKHFKAKRLFPFKVWVLRDNWPARKFYEKHGGQVIGNRLDKIGNSYYESICYLFE